MLGGSSGGLLFLRVSGTLGPKKKGGPSSVLDLRLKKKKKGGGLLGKKGKKGKGKISIMSSVQQQIRSDVKEGTSKPHP